MNFTSPKMMSLTVILSKNMLRGSLPAKRKRMIASCSITPVTVRTGKERPGICSLGGPKKGVFWGQHVLAMSNVEDWSKEIRIKHMLFILDCCASGMALTPKATIDDSGKFNPWQTLSGNGSPTVLTVNMADESTYALDGRETHGNGVFTKTFSSILLNHTQSPNKTTL